MALEKVVYFQRYWGELPLNTNDIGLVDSINDVDMKTDAENSSMLSLEDTIKIKGNISYACQRPWIYSASVKVNILFGAKYDRIWYNKVIGSCALISDFEQFPHSDETIIGENGINLSGGQRARVGLARAVYARRDIILMDDVLSAVDSVVGKHIFYNVFDSEQGIIKDSIRVLVTRSTQFLHRFDSIIVMQNGKIIHNDNFDNLTKQGINIQSLVDQTKH